MLISTAYAQAAGGAGSPNELFATLFPLVLIFAVFYFLIIRPQSKKMKQQKAMIEAIRRGDKVITAGGIVGTVAKVKEGGEVQLDIADNVRITVIQSTIASVLSKTEPADKAEKPAKDDKKDKKSKDQE